MSRYPRDERIAVGELQLHYRHWGGSGQPVVLLHGLASTCRIWELVAPLLSANFMVVALDQRGHGESDRPDHGYDFATVAADLHGFIQAIGIANPIVVGHSWGGDVALEYAVAEPDMVRGLCFVDGGTIDISGRPDATLESVKRDMAPPDHTGLTLNELKQRSRSWSLGQPMTPQLEEIVISNFEELPDGTMRARLSRDNHFRIIEALWDHRPPLLYPLVKCPVLLMPARPRDPESAQAKRFNRQEAIAIATKLLPTSKTVWLEDSIHDVPLQRPQLTADVIAEHIREGFFE